MVNILLFLLSIQLVSSQQEQTCGKFCTWEFVAKTNTLHFKGRGIINIWRCKICTNIPLHTHITVSTKY